MKNGNIVICFTLRLLTVTNQNGQMKNGAFNVKRKPQICLKHLKAQTYLTLSFDMFIVTCTIEISTKVGKRNL